MKLGTNYASPEFLDDGGVQLTDGGKQMVVGRGSVVWPSSHSPIAENCQTFPDTVWKAINGWGGDDCYELIFSLQGIEEFDWSTIRSAASMVGSCIKGLRLSELPVHAFGPICCWILRRASTPREKRRGIVVLHVQSLSFDGLWFDADTLSNAPVQWELAAASRDFEAWDLTRSDAMRQASLNRARRRRVVAVQEDSAVGIISTAGSEAEVATAMQEKLGAASAYFEAHPHLWRVLLLDFHGSELSSEQVAPLMSAVSVPPNVDEVWITQRDWIAENEFDIGYQCLFSAGNSASGPAHSRLNWLVGK